jgi:DNA-binding response OmpR family regulator
MMSDNPVIITIDRNQRNLELLAQFLNKEGYDTLSITSLESLDALLDSNVNAALALFDISGFDSTVWRRCEQVQNLGIPLLILSPKQSSVIQKESLAHGARGVIVKPLVARELIGLIKSMIQPET